MKFGPFDGLRRCPHPEAYPELGVCPDIAPALLTEPNPLGPRIVARRSLAS